MDYVLWLVVALLGCTALWLWRLAKHHSACYWLEVVLQREPRVSATPAVERLKVFYKPEYARESPERLPLVYLGNMTLGRQVYEGDSLPLHVALRAMQGNVTRPARSLEIGDSATGRVFSLQITRDAHCEQSIELELLAAAVIVGGEKKQRQGLNRAELAYLWNCHFQHSGVHTLSLAIRLVSVSEARTDVTELGFIHHKVRVVRLDGLTQAQVYQAAAASGVVTGALAILKLSRELGLL